MSVIEGPAHDLATRRIGVLEKELVETKKRFETMFQIAERRAAQVERAESCTDQMAIKLEDIQGRLTAERDALREALGPMLQYAILCIRQGRQDGLSERTIQIAERDLNRAEAALNSTDGE